MVTPACKRVSFPATLFGFALSCSAHAQAPCTPAALPEAAKAVASVRHELHGEAVGELDPAVPAPIAARLARLKNALAQAADAAMGCAGSAVTPDALQKTLAGALGANLSAASDAMLVTKAGKDLGAYGSDLEVQVLPLSSSPRYLEVDFRYGIECGDDNLLLLYKQTGGKEAGSAPWQQVLRWDAPGYRTVSDAFGDFILLTPLPGSAAKPNWRVVVAHGHPGCSTTDSRSRFDLDLLEPGTSPAHDQARPRVAWHLEQPYAKTDTPRLGTTEDTLTFELIAPAPDPGLRKPGAPTTTLARPTQIYRYRVSSDNHVQAIGAERAGAAPANAAPTPVSTNSPR